MRFSSYLSVRVFFISAKQQLWPINLTTNMMWPQKSSLFPLKSPKCRLWIGTPVVAAAPPTRRPIGRVARTSWRQGTVANCSSRIVTTFQTTQVRRADKTLLNYFPSRILIFRSKNLNILKYKLFCTLILQHRNQ